MLCSAMTGHRQDFEKFLGFYEKHLNKNGLMCWQQVQACMHTAIQQRMLYEALAVFMLPAAGHHAAAVPAAC